MTSLGTVPVTFSRSAGALPPGLALSSAGVISVVPGAPGLFDFIVLAIDALGVSNEQLHLLQIF